MRRSREAAPGPPMPRNTARAQSHESKPRHVHRVHVEESQQVKPTQLHLLLRRKGPPAIKWGGKLQWRTGCLQNRIRLVTNPGPKLGAGRERNQARDATTTWTRSDTVKKRLYHAKVSDQHDRNTAAVADYLPATRLQGPNANSTCIELSCRITVRV